MCALADDNYTTALQQPSRHHHRQVTRLHLQTRAVHNLEVDSELTTPVADDQDAEAATARLERALETVPEVGLLDDGEVLLDVARLGHGHNAAILDVEDAVLLQDGAEHGLDDDAGGRVGDGRRLLMELLGEEVDTEVAVLAGGRRGGDADDLAGAALQDEDVTQADVVAGNGDRAGAMVVSAAAARAGPGLPDLGHVNMVVATFRMKNSVSQLVHAVTERVVLA